MSAPVATGLAPEPASQEGPTERPIGVSVVAVLAFISAAAAILFALFAMAAGALIGSFFGSEGSAFGAALGAFIGVFALIGGAVAAVMGYGLWTGRAWAWILTIIFEGLSGASSLFAATRGNPEAIVSVLIAAGIIWYFFQPNVKRYFGRT